MEKKSQSAGNPFVESKAGAANASPQNQHVNSKSGKKMNKALKWSLIIGLPLLVLITAALIWYFAYFTNKYVVIRDAFYSMMDNRSDSSKYSFTANNSQAKVTGDGTFDYIDGGKVKGDLTASIKTDSISLTLPKIDLASDGSSLYFKVKLGDDLKKSIDLGTLDNQWVKLDSKDLASMVNSDSSDDSKLLSALQTCSVKGTDALKDKDGKKQVVDALIDTKFINVEAGKGDDQGALYTITLSSDKFGDFINQLIKTNYYKAIANCIKDKTGKEASKPNNDAIKEAEKSIKSANPTIKLWVKGFNRQVNKSTSSFDVTANDVTTNVEVTVDYAHTKPSITMPSNSKSLQDVLNENPQLIQGLMTLSSNSTSDNLTSDYSDL